MAGIYTFVLRGVCLRLNASALLTIFKTSFVILWISSWSWLVSEKEVFMDPPLIRDFSLSDKFLIPFPILDSSVVL